MMEIWVIQHRHKKVTHAACSPSVCPPPVLLYILLVSPFLLLLILRSLPPLFPLFNSLLRSSLFLFMFCFSASVYLSLYLFVFVFFRFLFVHLFCFLFVLPLCSSPTLFPSPPYKLFLSSCMFRITLPNIPPSILCAIHYPHSLPPIT